MDSHHTLAVCNFSECAPNRGTAAADDDGSVTVMGTAAARRSATTLPIASTSHCSGLGIVPCVEWSP